MTHPTDELAILLSHMRGLGSLLDLASDRSDHENHDVHLEVITTALVGMLRDAERLLSSICDEFNRLEGART